MARGSIPTPCSPATASAPNSQPALSASPSGAPVAVTDSTRFSVSPESSLAAIRSARLNSPHGIRAVCGGVFCDSVISGAVATVGGGGGSSGASAAVSPAAGEGVSSPDGVSSSRPESGSSDAESPGAESVSPGAESVSSGVEPPSSVGGGVSSVVVVAAGSTAGGSETSSPSPPQPPATSARATATATGAARCLVLIALSVS